MTYSNDLIRTIARDGEQHALAAEEVRLEGTEGQTPPCHICGLNKYVFIYREDAREQAICVECCGRGARHPDGETGHHFEYSRGDGGHFCRYCGINRNDTDYQTDTDNSWYGPN